MRKARLAPSPDQDQGCFLDQHAAQVFSGEHSGELTGKRQRRDAGHGGERIAMEMASPRISEVPTNAACFHGDRSWRTSSVRRPRPRDAEGAGEVDGAGLAQKVIHGRP